jgi:hypothetical protein
MELTMVKLPLLALNTQAATARTEATIVSSTLELVGVDMLRMVGEDLISSM